MSTLLSRDVKEAGHSQKCPASEFVAAGTKLSLHRTGEQLNHASQ